MDAYKSRSFFTYGYNSFSASIDSPVQGTEDGEDSASKILRGIVGKLAAKAAGIAECINSSLELDGDAYSINIVGAPVVIARVDGTHCGYSIHISIFPEFTNGNVKKNK